MRRLIRDRNLAVGEGAHEATEQEPPKVRHERQRQAGVDGGVGGDQQEGGLGEVVADRQLEQRAQGGPADRHADQHHRGDQLKRVPGTSKLLSETLGNCA